MALLGQLVIELAANTARLQSDMGKAVGIVERGATKIKGAFKFIAGGIAGGLIGSALASAGREAIKFGDDLNKAAIKAGIGGKAMSELAYAAKMADVDMASLSTAIKKMQVSLSEAASGAKEPNQALAALGLTIEQLQKLRPDQQFELLGDRISKLKDPSDRARAAVELFGKAGADLLPLFAEGAAGIAKARVEAEKLGLSFSDEQIKKLAAADDAIKRLDASWKGFATTLTAWVAPALSSVLDVLSGAQATASGRVAELQGQLQRAQARAGVSSNPAVKAQIDSLKQQLEEARIQQAAAGLPTGAGGRGRPTGAAPGFGSGEDIDEVREKFRAESRLADEYFRQLDEQTKTSSEKAGAQYERDRAAVETLYANKKISAEDYYARLKELGEEGLEEVKVHAKMSTEYQRKALTENQQIVKDGFLNAWDDWINTGKFKVDELFKYIIAEFARRQIAKLFDSIFGAVNKGGGGGSGGLFGGGGGLFGGGGFNPILNFGGGRAAGGPVESGKFYRVGENGPELLLAGSNGSVVPNGGGGMGGVYITASIDARGSTTDSIDRLPRILKTFGESLKADLIGGIKRKKYDIGLNQ